MCCRQYCPDELLASDGKFNGVTLNVPMKKKQIDIVRLLRLFHKIRTKSEKRCCIGHNQPFS